MYTSTSPTTTGRPDTSLAVVATVESMRTTPTFGIPRGRNIPSWRWRTAPMAGLAVAMLLAGTSFAESDDPAGPSVDGGAPVATELDGRGVPMWWAEGPSTAKRAPVATELDGRGVPVWWVNGGASGVPT